MGSETAAPDWSALKKMLAEHPCADANEKRDVGLVQEFLRDHPLDAHLRSQPLGHLTGSGFVLNFARTHALLLHHGKLNRWLQPGGHGEGEIDPCAIALREVREETGLQEPELTALLPAGAPASQALLFDVDIHTIPARKTEAEHSHLDLRFAWIARAGAAPRLSEESRALDWFPLEKPPEGADAALLRAFKKLAAAR